MVSGRLFSVPYNPHFCIRSILTFSAKGMESFVPLPLWGGLRTMTNIIFMLQWLKIIWMMGEGREQLIFRFFILKFNYASSSQNENPVFFVIQLLEHSKIQATLVTTGVVIATALYIHKHSNEAFKTTLTFHHANQKDHRAHFAVLKILTHHYVFLSRLLEVLRKWLKNS